MASCSAFFAALVAGAARRGVAAVGYVVGIANSASPDLSTLQAPQDPGRISTGVLRGRRGRVLGFIENDALGARLSPRRQIHEVIKDATVAVEDRRFYEHGGVDVEGILRAAVKNVEEGETVEGGSTLTMQLVRNLYISTREDLEAQDPRGEARRAAREHPHRRAGQAVGATKYLNVVPYGTTTARPPSASRRRRGCSSTSRRSA